jgi:hypothetical protein
MSRGKIKQIGDWMKDHHLPPKVVFIVTGVASTIWFLIRVIPKPSRAAYPCMRVAAPIMSGFVVYLLTLGGLAVFLKKTRQNFLRSRYINASLFLFASIIILAIFLDKIQRIPLQTIL